MSGLASRIQNDTLHRPRRANGNRMLQFAAIVLALYGIFLVPWHRHVANVEIHERALAEATTLLVSLAPPEPPAEPGNSVSSKESRRDERGKSTAGTKFQNASGSQPGKAVRAGSTSGSWAILPWQDPGGARDADTTPNEDGPSSAPRTQTPLLVDAPASAPLYEPSLPVINTELAKAWQILNSVRVASELRTTGVTLKDVLKPPGNGSDAPDDSAYDGLSLEDAKRLWRSALRSASASILAGANYTLADGDLRGRIFATKDTFHLTHAGASNEPQEPIADNFLASVLPPTGAPPQLDSCALVGNAKGLLREQLGADIDKHSAVIRINQAPAEGFEPFVGARTTHRLLNHKWASSYEAEANGMRTRKKRVEEPLYLEHNVTLIVSRTDWKEFRKLAKALRGRRPDVKLLLLSREEVDMAGDLLRFLKLKVEVMRGAEYRGKGSPSSGFLAVHLLLQMCKSLDVYGVGDGMEDSWHYFQTRQFKASREFGEAPHHSFDLEGDILQVMDGGGIIHHHLARPLSPPPEPPAEVSKNPGNLLVVNSQPPTSPPALEPLLEGARQADSQNATVDNGDSMAAMGPALNNSVPTR